MSQFERFLKSNKKTREPTVYAASNSFTDDSGEPVMWKIRPISTKENEAIRDECIMDDAGSGRYRLDVSKYTAKLLAASVVEPNLYDKELQDSYGVMTPEALILELLDNPAEYRKFAEFIQKYNGFKESFAERVDAAKN